MATFSRIMLHVTKLKSSQTGFLNKTMTVLKWPPQSPGLNPIEHLWNVVEREIGIMDSGRWDNLGGRAVACLILLNNFLNPMGPLTKLAHQTFGYVTWWSGLGGAHVRLTAKWALISWKSKFHFCHIKSMQENWSDIIAGIQTGGGSLASAVVAWVCQRNLFSFFFLHYL